MALEKKIIGRPQLSLLEEYNTNLLEIMLQRDGETLLYDGLVTGLSLEHARVATDERASASCQEKQAIGAQPRGIYNPSWGRETLWNMNMSSAAG